MIKVWGRATSSNVQVVMWCLAELDLPVERTDAGFTYGVTDTPEYLAMNPNGTVPTIQDGDNLPLWESGAILRYLASAYAKGAFWPADLQLRTDIDRWTEWAKVSIQMSFSVPIFWKVVRTPEAERDSDQLENSLRSFEKTLAIAEARLAKHRYLVNDDFTLADLQFGHILFRYFDIDIKRADLPALRRYYDELSSREHYQKHVMVNYDELRIS